MKQTIGEIIKSMFVGPDNNPPTNVIDILKADHRKVEGLFKQFESATSDEERKNLIDEIVKEISIHATVEEKLVYPELEGEGEKTKEALEEHHAVKLLLAELADMTGSEETAPAKVKVISEMVKHHIQEEELDLLPKLKRTADDLEELGNQVLQEKDLLLQNFKPPSRAEETMPETKRIDREKNSGVAPEDVLNFAPDADENSELESDENTVVFEPEVVSSGEPVSIEGSQIGGSEQSLPELADTSASSQSKPRRHRATSIRKKGGARTKAAHQPAKRTSGGAKAKSINGTAKNSKSTKDSSEESSKDKAKPSSKSKTAARKTTRSKSTSRKSSASKTASAKAKKPSPSKSKLNTKESTVKGTAAGKATRSSSKKVTTGAASIKRATGGRKAKPQTRDSAKSTASGSRGRGKSASSQKSKAASSRRGLRKAS